MQHASFDLDGTLTDSAEGIVRSLQFALDALGAAPRTAAELRPLIGPPLREGFRTLLESDEPELLEHAIRLYRQRFAERGLYENRVYPGIPELLTELRAEGLTLWVVTSKLGVFAHRIVYHFGMRPFFARVYGAEASGARSDKAELLAHLLATEGIPAQRCCMIGDRKHDVVGAAAHGIRSLGALWGFGSRAELEAAGATRLVESPSHVLDAIRALARS